MTEVKKQPMDNLAFDQEGFRMSTPQAIAKYKAERLRCGKIADLGAGIGIQALHFAAYSERVFAVDNDPSRLVYLRKNSETMGVHNLEVIEGNALDSKIINMLSGMDAFHSDPSRKRTSETWSFEDLSPNPLDVLKKYKGDMFSFDIPPMFPRGLLQKDWETEYISVSGELKRMSVYVGGAKRYGRSALSLPDGGRIVEDRNLERDVRKRSKPLSWIYDLDESLFYSDLVPEFLKMNLDVSLLHEDRQKTLVTSDKFVEGPFLTKSYSVLESAVDMQDAKNKLSRMKVGKVILRFPMDPTKYYEERRRLEKELEGERTAYLFRFGGMLFIAERVEKELGLEKIK